MVALQRRSQDILLNSPVWVTIRLCENEDTAQEVITRLCENMRGSLAGCFRLRPLSCIDGHWSIAELE
jgi:hypothetical protein